MSRVILNPSKSGGKSWTLNKNQSEKFNNYTSSWACGDGDIAELYIERDSSGFELECFSGIPASHIYLDYVDFSVFWQKAGLDKLDRPDFETQCFLIADYLCSLFCTYEN